MERVLVSVVVPVYNVEQYLGDCLDSILAQNYKKLEIICVDDGSFDNSPSLLADYATRDSRIKVVTQENRGLSGARNTGMKCARGKYIYFLDSDDMITSDAIEGLVFEADNDSLDLLVFDRSLIYESVELEDKYSSWKKESTRIGVYPDVMRGASLFAKMLNADEYRPNVSMYFYRRGFLEESGLTFYEGILHEDEPFSFMAMIKASRTKYLAKPYYLRRIREGSIMTVPRTYANFRGYFTGLVEMFRFAQQLELNGELDKNEQKAVWKKIIQMRENALKKYSQLPEKDQVGITWTDDAFTNSLFQMNEYLEVENQKKRVKNLRDEKEALVHSTSYKIGCAVTAPARQLRGWNITYKRLKPIARTDPGILKKLIYARFSRKKKIFLLGTPEHGNLGDHLIALSEKIFFENYFPDYEFFDCTMPFAKDCTDILQRTVRQEDILCLCGGGWLGTKWKHNEDFVRKIIKTFQKNPVVILPQTVYYENSEAYAREGAEIYAKHKRLLVCVREKASYRFMIDNGFSKVDNTLLMPDFALLYQGYKADINTRESLIQICLRTDVEKIVPDDMAYLIREKAGRVARIQNITTNIGPEKVGTDKREAKVLEKLSEISKGRLLVTDRLHAMIFAAITGTPCLAFDNATHKVKGVYEWIKQLDYIRMVDTAQDFAGQIQEMYDIVPKTSFDSLDFTTYKVSLRNKILEMAQ